jgi:hypothetical protein
MVHLRTSSRVAMNNPYMWHRNRTYAAKSEETMALEHRDFEEKIYIVEISISTVFL